MLDTIPISLLAAKVNTKHEHQSYSIKGHCLKLLLNFKLTSASLRARFFFLCSKALAVLFGGGLGMCTVAALWNIKHNWFVLLIFFNVHMVKCGCTCMLKIRWLVVTNIFINMYCYFVICILQQVKLSDY